ncbi:MAG: ferritin-like domain-containing protein [Gaiellaceae bacterium]
MSDHLTLEHVDSDGALQEAYEKMGGDTRAGFFKKALFAGGGLTVGGVVLGGLPALVSADPGPAQDVAILNFALTLEYLEAAFYKEALAMGALKGRVLKLAKVVANHEAQHVAALKGALGSAAIAKPTFNFKGTTSDQAKFMATSIVLEDTGVAAYNGQGQNLTKKTLAAAATIVSVEGRHAAWIRDIVGQNPAPAAFDPLKTKGQILAAVKSTGFITG